jgi:hypothetical protein
VLELEAALRHHDAIPVAVGSGTLNDLTKLAAEAGCLPDCVEQLFAPGGFWFEA